MPAPPRFEADVSLFPLVLSTMPERPTEADVDALITTLTELLEGRRPFVNVVDCRQQHFAATHFDRRRMTEWIGDAHLRELSSFKIADVIVTGNPLVRAATSAITWVFPSASPLLSVARLSEAEGFLATHCARAGVELPEAAWRRIRAD